MKIKTGAKKNGKAIFAVAEGQCLSRSRMGICLSKKSKFLSTRQRAAPSTIGVNFWAQLFKSQSMLSRNYITNEVGILLV